MERLQECEVDMKQMYQLERMLFLCWLQESPGPTGMKWECILPEAPKPRQHIKKQRHHLANKSPHTQSYGFFSSYVWMGKLDHKENWAPKNCCFWTVVLEKTLEGPLDCKEIQPVNSKGTQSWIFIGRIDAEAETPIL